MKEKLRKEEFFIADTSETALLLDKLEAKGVENGYLLLYVYMQKSVIAQTLKKELQRRFPALSFSFLKSEKRHGAKAVLYTLQTPLQEDEEIVSKILSLLDMEREDVTKSLIACKKESLQKFFRDNLTTLPNVFQLRKDLQECEEVTLIDVTIDDFKSLNSFYGFIVGDYILEKAGYFLKEIAPGKVYKMPGGEFIVLQERLYSYYELDAVLKELYERLSHFQVDYKDIQIRLDFTLSACTAKSIENILAKLSIAHLYAIENKLPYFIYEDRLDFQTNYKENLMLSGKIRRAIERDDIVAYYQPIIDTKTGKISKYETLARLIDENGEVLAPDRFLQISKKAKLYHLVTKKMIESAFSMFADNGYEFSINISKEDIVNQETFDFIIETLRSSNASDRVVFEFVESDALVETERILEFVKEIKRYGAKIAIDDFGSGYSNFSMLISMKVDYIKIDGSLISVIDQSWSSALVVESIVEFAKKLGVATIAEYVHSSTLLSRVKRMGIDFSQGFYIDKPRIDIKETSI